MREDISIKKGQRSTVRQLRPELVVQSDSASLELRLRRSVLVKELVESPGSSLSEGTFAGRTISELMFGGYQSLDRADQRRKGRRPRMKVNRVGMVEPKGGSDEALLIIVGRRKEPR
jgi:hypothetical protein